MKETEEKALLFELMMFLQNKEFDETYSKLSVRIAGFGRERFKVKK